MNTNSRALIVVLGLFVIGQTSASARVWAKHHHAFSFDGETLNQWTTISTVDDEWPFTMRMLYQDAAGNRLLVRLSGPEEGTSLTTITDVATGETVSFSAVPGTLTVGVGSQQIVIPWDDSFHTTHGFQYPESVRSQAATLYATLSSTFRGALLRFTQAGCLDSLDLYTSAFHCAYLFYDGTVNCSSPPRSSPPSTNYLSPFDPSVTAPDAYEQAFGQAYFQ
jgi:hypothetical protein